MKERLDLARLKSLATSPLIQRVYQTSRQTGASGLFLVGGALRNLLWGFAPETDLDFVVKGEVERLAQSFAQKIGGSLVPLDRKRGHYRVVLKEDQDYLKVDFSRLSQERIEENLSQRDFSLNALALDLFFLFKGELRVFDPQKGLPDLGDRLLRVISAQTFEDDPLRMLRAVRLKAQYDLNLEERTERLIKEKKGLLLSVSAERIKNEFFQILNRSRAAHYLRIMDNLGLLGLIIPEIESFRDLPQGPWHSFTLLKHSFKTVEFAEVFLKDLTFYFSPYHLPLKEHFRQQLEEEVERTNLLKFLALLHDSGKPKAQKREGDKLTFFNHSQLGEKLNLKIARRLKLGRKAQQILALLTKNHMRILNLSQLNTVTSRSKYRLFRDLGENSFEALILSLADGAATQGILDLKRKQKKLSDLVKELLLYYLEEYQKVPPKPLLNGREIMTILGLSPGKRIGEVLSRLREAEAEGLISNKEEAISWLKTKKVGD